MSNLTCIWVERCLSSLCLEDVTSIRIWWSGLLAGQALVVLKPHLTTPYVSDYRGLHYLFRSH